MSSFLDTPTTPEEIAEYYKDRALKAEANMMIQQIQRKSAEARLVEAQKMTEQYRDAFNDLDDWIRQNAPEYEDVMFEDYTTLSAPEIVRTILEILNFHTEEGPLPVFEAEPDVADSFDSLYQQCLREMQSDATDWAWTPPKNEEEVELMMLKAREWDQALMELYGHVPKFEPQDLDKAEFLEQLCEYAKRHDSDPAVSRPAREQMQQKHLEECEWCRAWWQGE